MLKFRAICEQAADLVQQTGRIAYVVAGIDGTLTATLNLDVRGECLLMIGRYGGSVHILDWRPVQMERVV